MSSLSCAAAVPSGEMFSFVLTSRYAPAGQPEMPDGLIQNANGSALGAGGPWPMVPVLPTTVIENVEPRLGVALDSVTEVILFAFAPIVDATLPKPPEV